VRRTRPLKKDWHSRCRDQSFNAYFQPEKLYVDFSESSILRIRASAAPAREASGISLPEVVKIHGRDLALNGMAVGKEKVFFDVYVIGLYLEARTSDALTAIKTDEEKRIVLTMLRDVSREKFVRAVEKGMMRNSGQEMPALRARLDLLEQALPALKKGNVLDFTYVPGTGTVVRGQGQELAIPGKDFADALFSAWLGPEPDSRALKRELLGG
jgi:Chalcone isomerase-like